MIELPEIYDNMEEVPPTQIDISSKMNDFPQFRGLSNLAPKEFVMDGIQFLCLEGFLQVVQK